MISQPTHRPLSIWDIVNCALISSALNGSKSIRQLVDSVVNHPDFKSHHGRNATESTPGTINVTLDNRSLDGMFYRGLSNYKAGSVLDLQAAELELEGVLARTSKQHPYNEVADRILKDMWPRLYGHNID